MKFFISNHEETVYFKAVVTERFSATNQVTHSGKFEIPIPIALARAIVELVDKGYRGTYEIHVPEVVSQFVQDKEIDTLGIGYSDTTATTVRVGGDERLDYNEWDEIPPDEQWDEVPNQQDEEEMW